MNSLLTYCIKKSSFILKRSGKSSFGTHTSGYGLSTSSRVFIGHDCHLRKSSNIDTANLIN